jgi:hypothetical protein
MRDNLPEYPPEWDEPDMRWCPMCGEEHDPAKDCGPEDDVDIEEDATDIARQENEYELMLQNRGE